MTMSAPYFPSSLARSFRPFPIARAYSFTLRRSASLLPSVTASKLALRNVGPDDSAKTRTSPVKPRSPWLPRARASLVLEQHQLLFQRPYLGGAGEDFG